MPSYDRPGARGGEAESRGASNGLSMPGCEGRAMDDRFYPLEYAPIIPTLRGYGNSERPSDDPPKPNFRTLQEFCANRQRGHRWLHVLRCKRLKVPRFTYTFRR